MIYDENITYFVVCKLLFSGVLELILKYTLALNQITSVFHVSINLLNI